MKIHLNLVGDAIYKFENMFYSVFDRSEVNNESEVKNMDFKTKVFLTIVGILLGMIRGV